MFNIGGLPLFTSAAYKTIFADAFAEATQALSAQKMVYEQLYEEIPTTDVSVDLSTLSAVPRMRPMRASHPQDGGSELGGTLRKIPYKAEVTMDRDLVESTNGQYLVQERIKALAKEAAGFKMDLINDVILGNPVGWDGVTHFNAAHPAWEHAGAQSNVAATAFAAGAGYVTELPNFMNLLSSAGNTMGIIPDVILTSPTLWPNAMTYFNPNRVNFMDSGVATGSLPISPIEKVGYVYTTDNNTVTATEWFMFSTRYKKPFVVVETEAPVIEVTPLDSSEYLIQRQLHIVVSWFGVAGVGPWFLSYQSNV